LLGRDHNEPLVHIFECRLEQDGLFPQRRLCAPQPTEQRDHHRQQQEYQNADRANRQQLSLRSRSPIIFRRRRGKHRVARRFLLTSRTSQQLVGGDHVIERPGIGGERVSDGG
jgi:hypothetical protein